MNLNLNEIIEIVRFRKTWFWTSLRQKNMNEQNMNKHSKLQADTVSVLHTSPPLTEQYMTSIGKNFSKVFDPQYHRQVIVRFLCEKWSFRESHFQLMFSSQTSCLLPVIVLL